MDHDAGKRLYRAPTRDAAYRDAEALEKRFTGNGQLHKGTDFNWLLKE
jgi:hypothetical protein